MAARSDFRRLVREEDRMRLKHQAKHPMPDAMLVQPGDAELGIPKPPSYPDGPISSSYACRIYELKSAEWSVVRKAGVFTTTGREVDFLDQQPPSAAARARADEIIAAEAKWRRKFDRRPAALRTIERRSRAASKLADRLRSKLDRTRAHTIAGLAVKAQVAAIEGEEDTQFADTTLESILRDIRKLNPAALS
jgi:hypothetical protein